jgi:hypothetical protein
VTPGQERGLRELRRLALADAHGIEILGDPRETAPWLNIDFSLRVGLLETREGGLRLREREEFVLSIPQEFPFEIPSLLFRHERFARFPHVCWKFVLCLYQSKLEWIPSDGLFGFFDRLALWLGRAARNDMDPIEGPLEPPHHITDTSQDPIVMRAKAPVPPGTQWIGWARLEKLRNSLELASWHELNEPVPGDMRLAPAIFLAEPLPMEFPLLGRDLFKELLERGVGRGPLLSLLALSALETPEGERAYILLGLPMRRAADGTLRQHIAGWATAERYAGSLRRVIPEDTDSAQLRTLRSELADAIYAVFEHTDIAWCPILEDRDEIVVRRDSKTPMAWFVGKRVLVLGAGGLGSWTAEMIARARPTAIDVVDNTIVKPGLLARQNYVLNDIGSPKAEALTRRLGGICHGASITAFTREAHRFLLSEIDRLNDYDVVVDCTASSILSMKLERDWRTLRPRIRRLITFVIDAHAQQTIGVALGPESVEGPWSARNRLKYKLTAEDSRSDLAAAFYDPNVTKALFQPEPGCSDPTFAGSMADVSRLAASALNALTATFKDDGLSHGLACTLPDAQSEVCRLDAIDLPVLHEALATPYRVLISAKVLNQARACVRQNQRLRSAQHETGGLLWGYWDDAAGIILVLDASGPPPDSRHDPGHFICGTSGTDAEHQYRLKNSFGVCGFLGLWHTHPDVPPSQSVEDMVGMATLVAQAGQNQRRALMMIFGRTAGVASAGVFVYEGQPLAEARELVQVGVAQLPVQEPVV